jgi:hypothetical protein
MQVIAPAAAESEASPGDALVLAPGDPEPPRGWVLMATERAPANPIDGAAPRPALVLVYQLARG